MIAAVIAASEILFFIFSQRPIAVRLTRVGVFGLFFGLLRLLLWVIGYSWLGWWDYGSTVALLLLAVASFPARRIWLVRSLHEQFLEQVQAACRGLFIRYQQINPGQATLSTKSDTFQLYAIQLFSRFQLVVLPRPTGRDKILLLLKWLHKQYSGPIPRLRIVLKGARHEPR